MDRLLTPRRARSSALRRKFALALSLSVVLALALGGVAVGARDKTAAGTTKLKGRVDLLVEMGTDGAMQHHAELTTTAGKRYRVRATGHQLHELADLNQAEVEIDGTVDGDDVRPAKVRKTKDAKAPAAMTARAAASGPRRMIMVIFTFKDSPEYPAVISKATGEQMMFTAPNSVKAFWADHGIDVTGQVVTDQATMARTCDYRAWQSYYEHRYSNYDHLLLVGPAGCGSSGLAYMPGKLSFYFGLQPQYLFLLYHELGHNLGMAHARAITCVKNGNKVSLGGTCTPLEYGDPFDPMGQYVGRCAYQPFNRRVADRAVDMQEVRNSATVSLRALDGPNGSAPQELLIPRNNSDDLGEYYSIEWRRQDFEGCRAGWGPEPPANGLIIRAVSANVLWGMRTNLIDTTPGTNENDTYDFWDAPLAPGSSFTDTKSNLTIRLDGISGDVATVTVAFGSAPPPPPTTTPTTAAPPTTPPSSVPPINTIGVRVAGNTIRYIAQSGQTNNVRVTQSGSSYTIEDVYDVVPGPGCTSETATRARCTLANAAKVFVDLGDRDDRFSSNATTLVHVQGGHGNDVFDAGNAANGPTEYHGGTGIDLVDYSSRTNRVVVRIDNRNNDGEAGERDLVAKDVEDVHGGSGNDDLRASGNVPNTLVGNGGNDLLLGRAGKDTLIGGPGNDDLRSKDGAADQVDCGPGNDVARNDKHDVVVGCEKQKR